MRRFVLLLAVSALGFAPAPLPKHRKPTSADEVRRSLEGTWAVESHSVGGVVQGGPGLRWESVRIVRGTWTQSTRVKANGWVNWTTPYLITIHAKGASRIDMAYRPGDKALIYGILQLDGDRL